MGVCHDLRDHFQKNKKKDTHKEDPVRWIKNTKKTARSSQTMREAIAIKI